MDSESYPERLLKKLDISKINYDTNHKIIFGNSRNMKEVSDETVHLIVTSPPYPMIEMWDNFFHSFGCNKFNEMHDYLNQIWKECHRVLIDGGIACINIGDATRNIDGTFRLYSNHSKIIESCQKIGFTTLPYILWKKPTTKPNPFLGSGFIPTNAYVTLDCEYILIFRKGNIRKFKPKDPYRYASQYSKKERDTWFSQIWVITGAKQENNSLSRRTAEYPNELVYRLIRMFSIIGDTVLDPFLGTATTTEVAIKTNRNSIGYEIDTNLKQLIKNKIFQSTKSMKETNFNIKYIENL